MRRLLIALVVAALLAGCAGGAGETASPSGNTPASGGGGSGAAARPPGAVVLDGSAVSVDMIEMAYAPKDIVVKAGTTVTWTNRDDIGHTVSPYDTAKWGTTGSGDAPDQWLNEGDAWSFTFNERGTFRYYCLPHATKAGDGYIGMIGSVTVE